ncbi:lysoplasmalogenase [Mycetocola zhadangensis]|uniref:Lysoplasmalogenase n=1 Tax=Mycetocola zhadangensis TaxID=1164595 RepID=A0A3L7J6K2_9MICO|nr:lysoplasmalogenase [Mycetocola zhadangensis]RLQ86089.1 lysoplasmalogenase [Mycetocola zhadangensis]GGE88281.1 hypothetical protein GCM10011313_08700 [Mycetocola zhadangensis]
MSATPTRSAFVAIAVFVAVSVLHLGALIIGAEQLSSWTKPLLMPTLAIAVIVVGGLRSGGRGYLLMIALLFSTVGDIALLGEGNTLFLIGLGAFLVAHIVYIAIFVGPTGRGWPRWWSAIFVVWFGILMAALVPHLDELLLPVVGYGVVIATMAIVSTRCAPRVMLGALLFLMSDSILALNLFVPNLEMWQPDLLIMFTYLAGQGLIAWGLVVSWRDRASDLSPTSKVASR